MAKKKKFEAEDDVPALSMTPMIDVTFLLLIFFMLACKFRTVEGKLKAYLPKDRGQGTSTPVVDLGELRVKLLWCRPGTREPYPLRRVGTKFDAYYETVKDGHVMLKVGEHVFNYVDSKMKWPDYNALFDHVEAAKANYKPPRDKPTKTMPVIIDAREAVEWKHVVAVLNAAVKAGLTDITFAAPEIPY